MLAAWRLGQQTNPGAEEKKRCRSNKDPSPGKEKKDDGSRMPVPSSFPPWPRGGIACRRELHRFRRCEFWVFCRTWHSPGPVSHLVACSQSSLVILSLSLSLSQCACVSVYCMPCHWRPGLVYVCFLARMYIRSMSVSTAQVCVCGSSSVSATP